MDSLPLAGPGSVGTITGSSRTEVVLLGVIAAIALVLVLARYLRSRNLRRRRGTAAYFARDADRQGRTGRGSAPSAQNHSTTPSFSASHKGSPSRVPSNRVPSGRGSSGWEPSDDGRFPLSPPSAPSSADPAPTPRIPAPADLPTLAPPPVPSSAKPTPADRAVRPDRGIPRA